MRLRSLILIAALSWSVPAMAQHEGTAADPAAAKVDPYAAQTDPAVLSVASRLACNCGTCPHEPVDKCRCGTAMQLRYEIAQLLATGMTGTQVYAAMVSRHGPGILAEPPNTFGGIFAKRVMPVGLFLLGVGLVSMVIFRWRKRDVLEHPAGAAPSAEAAGEETPAKPGKKDDDYLARIEEELESRS